MRPFGWMVHTAEVALANGGLRTRFAFLRNRIVYAAPRAVYQSPVKNINHPITLPFAGRCLYCAHPLLTFFQLIEIPPARCAMSSCTRCFSELSDLSVFCPHCSQANAPAFNSLLNQTVAARYHIQQRLTGGGLSAVFLATDLQPNSPVVLKFSDPQHLTRRDMTFALDATTTRAYWSEMLERMRHEAEMLLSLQHPHIVKLQDTGTLNDDLRYLVLEYLEGTTLRDTLLRQPRPTLTEALRITLTLADALAHVHARGIVHRDLNPRNVMLCGKERTVKLIDFGIAKFPQPPNAPPFTQHSLLRGTVTYASPEQCQNETLDARSDLYSLGVMLYEMVTGQKPFNGRTPTEIALQQIQTAPVAPRQLNSELTPDLEAFILRTLAKRPADRPASAAAFAAELRSAARRIVIELPEAVLPAPAQIQNTPTVAPFHFTSLERAAAPRRTLAKTLAATAMLALALATATGSSDFANSSDFIRWMKAPPAHELAAFKTADGETSSAASSLPTTAEPDAFEAMTQPLRSWTTALSAKATLPQSRAAMRDNKKDKVSATQPVPSVFATPLAPFLMTATQAAPPYAFPSGGNAWQPETNSSVPSIGLPLDSVTASIDQAAPPIQPEPRRSKAISNSNLNDDETWQPRLISWNGEVNGERLLRIELPGQPGVVEIPRAFRHRVGIIEPPQPGNDWRCVRLRVIGRGAVNLVIRWWPK